MVTAVITTIRLSGFVGKSMANVIKSGLVGADVLTLVRAILIITVGEERATTLGAIHFCAGHLLSFAEEITKGEQNAREGNHNPILRGYPKYSQSSLEVK